MKIRKIAAMVVIAVGMCLVLTGCGDKYITIPEKRWNQILECLVRLEELETQQNNSSEEEQAQEPTESVPSTSSSQKAEQEQPEVEKVLVAAITENDRSGKQVDVKVFDDMKTAVSKASATLGKSGNITVSLFDVPISEVSVTTNTSNYVTYTPIKIATVSEVDGGYSTFNYDYPEKTRVIFRIVTTTGDEYFISVKT